jgi:hypothetical protein
MSLALSKVHFKGLIPNDIFGVGVHVVIYLGST